MISEWLLKFRPCSTSAILTRARHALIKRNQNELLKVVMKSQK